MMQKDEVLLLRPWVAFHGALVGYENLTIFDNGSTQPEVIRQLADAEEAGVEVIRHFNSVEDFNEKGSRISERIQHFDIESPADFYFPLDCDEFLVSQVTEGVIRVDRAGLHEALRPHLATSKVLRISFGFDNDPRGEGRFFAKGRLKSFFACGTCVSLDLGFHRGRTREGADSVTGKVGYLHMHNKPWRRLQDDARKKMVGRVPNFERETLLAHREARGRGFHLINEILLESEAEYFEYVADKYKGSGERTLGEFVAALKRLGTPLPY